MSRASARPIPRLSSIFRARPREAASKSSRVRAHSVQRERPGGTVAATMQDLLALLWQSDGALRDEHRAVGGSATGTRAHHPLNDMARWTMFR